MVGEISPTRVTQGVLEDTESRGSTRMRIMLTSSGPGIIATRGGPRNKKNTKTYSSKKIGFPGALLKCIAPINQWFLES